MPIVRTMGEIVNILAWDKGNCTAGDLAATYGQQWEAILFARKSRVPLAGGRDRDVLRYSRGNTSAYHHPTQKPVELLSFLIGKHDNVDIVLDPFGGGGSTALSALAMGKQCISIEVEERYCAIAADRIDKQFDEGVHTHG